MKAPHRIHHPSAPLRGVTLTELLVVLVIIGILATIAVPVYINHAERAKIATAEQEVKEIAQAEDACAVIHGFYVPLEVLDDLPGSRTNGTNSDSDGIQSETGQVTALDYNLPINLLVNNGAISFNLTTNNPKLRAMIENWAGPFLNPQRVYDNTPENRYDYNDADFPLDPWGNPYRLYSPVGIIGTTDVSGTYDINDFSNFGTNDSRFDRWAIVSYGPDGQEDVQGALQSDDVIYTFGIVRESENNPNATNP